MKKTICILLALLTMCTFGCTKSNTTSADAATENSVEYTIYLGGSDLSGLVEDENTLGRANSAAQLTVARKSLPDDCDFTFMLSDTPENVNSVKKKDFSIAEKTYQLEFTRSRTNSLASSGNQSLRRYGSVDDYSTENYSIEFLQESGELRYYSDHSIDQMTSGGFTMDEAIIAAQNILNEQFGAKCIEYYGMQPEVSEVTSDRHNIFVVTYTKYIGGYRTNDIIQLRYNKQGELLCINANYYGIMESVENKYSIDQLQAAEIFLTDYLDSMSCAYTEDSITLQINSNGECYFKLYGTYSIGEDSRIRAFYVNVE